MVAVFNRQTYNTFVYNEGTLAAPSAPSVNFGINGRDDTDQTITGRDDTDA